jgi:hypothetical protein
MATTPTGKESLALGYLRDTIAESATFKTWTGTSDSTAAKAKVFYSSAASGTYPCAVINTDDFSREQIADGTAMQKGAVLLEFYDDYAAATSEGDALLDMLNKTGAVVDEMMAAANAPGMLNISEVNRLGMPFKVSDEEAATSEKVYYAAYRVGYWGS